MNCIYQKCFFEGQKRIWYVRLKLKGARISLVAEKAWRLERGLRWCVYTNGRVFWLFYGCQWTCQWSIDLSDAPPKDTNAVLTSTIINWSLTFVNWRWARYVDIIHAPRTCLWALIMCLVFWEVFILNPSSFSVWRRSSPTAWRSRIRRAVFLQV